MECAGAWKWEVFCEGLEIGTAVLNAKGLA